MISALQPMIRQWRVDMMRARLLATVERKHHSRVIAMVQGKETMSFLGFPVVRHIDFNDCEQVLRGICVIGRCGDACRSHTGKTHR